MSITQIYGVVLPVEVARQARIAAASQGLSRSRLIRQLLEDYLLSQTLAASGLRRGPETVAAAAQPNHDNYSLE
jgi:hypothetical protein